MTNLKLKSGFPKVWGDLAFQNQMLRHFVGLALLISILALSLILFLVKRKPMVITLDQNARVIEAREMVSIEAEAEKAVHQYIGLRYAWAPSDQTQKLNAAKQFVAPQSMKAFEKTVAELVSFSKDKNLLQRVYPTSIKVNAKESLVNVIADRFTEIQGLKAATLLRANLTYQNGPRTIQNPWGIYIIKEEEGQ